MKRAPETGLRHKRLAKLKKQGPLGRHLARAYALEWVTRDPAYGKFFVLRNRGLWVGMRQEEIRRALGPPDEVRGNADVWWIGRRSALERLKWDHGYSWDLAQRDWYECLAAEYEDGVLVRFGDPLRRVRYSDDIEQSPYQTHLKVDVDLDQIDTPPPEWVKAKAGK